MGPPNQGATGPATPRRSASSECPAIFRRLFGHRPIIAISGARAWGNWNMILSGSCHCGATGWALVGDPGSITACNCTLCHRYGALWAYDYEGERVAVAGETRTYRRIGKEGQTLEMIFCPVCAGVLAWRGLQAEADGRIRMAVNVRLAPLEAVADLSIDHFDGMDSFEDLPAGGKVVRDLWA